MIDVVAPLTGESGGGARIDGIMKEKYRQEGLTADSNAKESKEQVQVEVDIRVKCERPPYETYAWVWWAWWAHRRSPVGVVFALVQGVFAFSSVSPQWHFLLRSSSFSLVTELVRYVLRLARSQA